MEKIDLNLKNEHNKILFLLLERPLTKQELILKYYKKKIIKSNIDSIKSIKSTKGRKFELQRRTKYYNKEVRDKTKGEYKKINPLINDLLNLNLIKLNGYNRSKKIDIYWESLIKTLIKRNGKIFNKKIKNSKRILIIIPKYRDIIFSKNILTIFDNIDDIFKNINLVLLINHFCYSIKLFNENNWEQLEKAKYTLGFNGQTKNNHNSYILNFIPSKWFNYYYHFILLILKLKFGIDSEKSKQIFERQIKIQSFSIFSDEFKNLYHVFSGLISKEFNLDPPIIYGFNIKIPIDTQMQNILKYSFVKVIKNGDIVSFDVFPTMEELSKIIISYENYKKVFL